MPSCLTPGHDHDTLQHKTDIFFRGAVPPKAQHPFLETGIHLGHFPVLPVKGFHVDGVFYEGSPELVDAPQQGVQTCGVHVLCVSECGGKDLEDNKGWTPDAMICVDCVPRVLFLRSRSL